MPNTTTHAIRTALLSAILLIAASAQSAPFQFVREMISSDVGPVLAAADVDLDGDNDLITVGPNPVQLNDGTGRFTPHPTPSTMSLALTTRPARPRHVVADLNGDSFPDVLGADSTGLLTRWMNQGGGTFLPVAGSLPPIAVVSLSIADVDGDGDPDLLCATSSTVIGATGTNQAPVVVLLNNGSGGFTVGPVVYPGVGASTEAILVDLDQDGDKDVVGFVNASLDIWVCSNLGNNTFGPIIHLGTGSTDQAIAMGDIDADGRPDFVLDSVNSPLLSSVATVFRNAGGFAFTPSTVVGAGNGSADSVLSDLNGDGRAELLRFRTDGCDVHFLSGGAFQPPVTTVPVYARIQHGPISSLSNWIQPRPVIVDVDGDSDRDFVVFTLQGNVIVGLGPQGTLVPLQDSIASPEEVTAGDVIDFDGDGDLDLVPTDTVGIQLIVPPGVVRNDGRGQLRWAGHVLCSQCLFPAWVFQFFDVDGDGDADLYWSGFGAYQFFLNSSGVFTPAWPAVGGGSAGTRGVPLDVDSDGDLDYVVGVDYAPTPNPAPASLMRNLGGGNFAPPVPLPTPMSAPIVGDFDGNGMKDIYWSLNGSLGSLFNYGAGTLSAGPVPPAPPMAALDVDRDGDLDLLAGGQIYLNPGTGVFGSAGAIPLSATTSCFVAGSMHAADFDGDGWPDVIDACGQFHRNLANGTFAAPVSIGFPLQSEAAQGDFDGDGDVDLISTRLRLLTNTTRQLVPGGPVRPGRIGSLDLYGFANQPWHLFASNGTSFSALPPYGIVRLDVSALVLAASGTFGANGRSGLSVTVPNNPALVGLTVWWQALAGEPVGPRLSGLSATTVLGF